METTKEAIEANIRFLRESKQEFEKFTIQMMQADSGNLFPVDLLTM